MAMNESQQYTPSELIYLFLDGEADGIQQSTLFAALARDAELQGEFQEAVLVARTLDRVRNDVHPPQDFTDGVFAAAGFTTPQYRPVPVPLAGKWSASLNAIIRQTGIPIVSALIGALTVFLLMNFGSEDKLSTAVQSTAKNRSGETLSARGHEAFASGQEIAGTANRYPVTSNRDNTKNETFVPDAVAKKHVVPESSRPTHNTPIVTSSVFAEETTSDHTSINDLPPAEIAVESGIDSDAFQPTVEPPMPVVEQALLQVPVQQLEHSRSYADLQPIYRWENTTSRREPGVSLFVRGIESINSFPSRKNNIEASGSTSNVGFGCLYYYSQNQALGMEVARELLPIYNTGEDNPELNSVLVWIGGLWQIQTDFPGLRSDIQPFLRLGLGGTAYGPSGKALVGIMYTAEQRLSISLGLETTALLAIQNGKIGSTEKIAFSYGLSFHF